MPKEGKVNQQNKEKFVNLFQKLSLEREKSEETRRRKIVLSEWKIPARQEFFLFDRKALGSNALNGEIKLCSTHDLEPETSNQQRGTTNQNRVFSKAQIKIVMLFMKAAFIIKVEGRSPR